MHGQQNIKSGEVLLEFISNWQILPTSTLLMHMEYVFDILDCNPADTADNQANTVTFLFRYILLSVCCIHS